MSGGADEQRVNLSESDLFSATDIDLNPVGTTGVMEGNNRWNGILSS